MKISFITGLFSLCIVYASSWNINDVSYLLKLPSINNNTLLAPQNMGVGGELFTEEIYNQKIMILSVPSPEGSKTYSNLRAVSFRFDPCPQTENINSSCSPEFRIVWQPVYFDDADQKWTTEDAAIHTFYKLSPKQYKNMRDRLFNLKLKMESKGVFTKHVALGIHPALLNQKTANLFESELYQIVLSNIGQENFYKFTFMRLLVQLNWWKFMAGFEKNNSGKWVAAQIASHGGSEIDLINDATEVNQATGLVEETDASIFILRTVRNDEDLRRIVSSGFRSTVHSARADIQDLSQFKITLKAVNKFQNPKLSNPHTIDCLSCHYADTANQFAMKAFPALKGFLQKQENYYENPNKELYNCENNSIALKSSKVMRTFGYFDDRPSIMTRVINDSIESAEWLNNN
jgi:hypothetical protein